MKRRYGAARGLIVLSDDESTDDRRAGIKVKVIPEPQPVPPPPSTEVLELRQKVAKLEKDFQDACRYARRWELQKEEAQKRVEFLEDIIDKKPAKIDDSTRKLVEEWQRKLEEVKEEAALKEDKMQERIDSLTEQLERERTLATEDRRRDRDKYIHLSQQLEAEKLKAYDDLTRFHENMEELRRQNERLIRESEDRVRDRARIDELTCLLAEYEVRSQQQQQPPPSPYSMHLVPPPPPPTPEAPLPQQKPVSSQMMPRLAVQRQQPTKITPQKKKPITQTNYSQATAQIDNHSRNIFKLVFTDNIASIAFSSVIEQLRALFNVSYDVWNERYIEAMSNEILRCEVCNNYLTSMQILVHLFSPVHAKQLRVKAGYASPAVSLVAFEYWKRKLESIRDPPQAPPPIAAAAVDMQEDVEMADG